MGLLDFWLKKKELQDEEFSYDIDNHLQDELKRKLEQQGHTVEIDDGSILVDSRIEILTTVFSNSELASDAIHLHAVIKIDDYFLNGIKEKFVGIGVNDNEKVDSLTDEFISVSLLPVFRAFTDNSINLNFSILGDSTVWHPILGPYCTHGEWGADLPADSDLFLLLQPWLKDQLPNSKFNWLKVNIAKQVDGKISGYCYLNNELKESGYNLLKNYARSWNNNKQFRSIKQFILIRRSDVS